LALDYVRYDMAHIDTLAILLNFPRPKEVV